MMEGAKKEFYNPLAGESLCSREKYWSEIDVDKKVERCRREIKSLKKRVAFLSNLVDKLCMHNHSADGELCVRCPPAWP